MKKIDNIKINKDFTDDELIKYICKKFSINIDDILEWHILKKSIDARNKNDIHYLYNIAIKFKSENKYKKFKDYEFPIPNIIVNCNKNFRPVIVGAGPAGLFSALTFIKNGIKPIIIEQGKTVEERQNDVNLFLKTGKLNTNSNVQFGEGGAGTFSDGKLTSGINNPLCNIVLQDFYKFGAPKQILYLSKPHIGTDNLIKIIRNIRNYIIKNGGEFLFNSKVVDFSIKNNKVESVTYINDGKEYIIPTSNVILAIGHSSRDTFYKVFEKGLNMESKNFSVGVRVEHLQKNINLAQYGDKTKLKLPPAEYKLAYHDKETGRSCYTFCMCPGGTVMASSSEENTIVTNGMSYFKRDGVNANSAVLVNVTPADFSSSSPLAGIDFQKELEEKAFIAGGKNYFAPIQKLVDFMNNSLSNEVGEVKPTYLPGFTFYNLNLLLPNFVTDTMKKAFVYFDNRLHGFANPDSILTGVETRSSSPVRIIRGENFMSNIEGIYPCGEGAGYAGGIMSASVDGIKCSLASLKNNM